MESNTELHREVTTLGFRVLSCRVKREKTKVERHGEESFFRREGKRREEKREDKHKQVNSSHLWQEKRNKTLNCGSGIWKDKDSPHP